MDRTFREGKSDVMELRTSIRFFFESYFVDFSGAGIRAPASNADWQQEFHGRQAHTRLRPGWVG